MSDDSIPYGSTPQPPKAPAGTSSNTPFIWVIVALPLITLVEFLLFDFDGYMLASVNQQTAGLSAILYPGYLLIQAIGVLLYLVTALLAFLDWRALGRAGIPRPFFWAWVFLGGIVYVVGRSVVVRRRTGAGLAPLWVSIGITAVTIVFVLVKTVAAIGVAVRYAEYVY